MFLLDSRLNPLPGQEGILPEDLWSKETLLEALRLPGIIEYAVHLFFVKLSEFLIFSIVIL